jgi:hypothetical protein
MNIFLMDMSRSWTSIAFKKSGGDFLFLQKVKGEVVGKAFCTFAVKF